MRDVINNEGERLTFEDFKNENGIIYWWASDLMQMLGYPNMKSFQKVLDRVTKFLVSLNIPHYENIFSEQRIIEGKSFQDFKMTRFACHIAVMNADPKKVEVAEARAYFAQQTRKFELYIENHQEIERVMMMIRDELLEGNKALSSAVKRARVLDYAKFSNTGYLGMYNMENWKLAKKRNIQLMDSMGRTELAANLFRVTQTEEKLKAKECEDSKH